MQIRLLIAALALTGHVIAQCPYFSSCPTGVQLYCDYSNNDSLYWKATGYTWSPALMLADLPEADVDLSMVARDSCGGLDVMVSYTLFLDLDGNDTTETVIQSDALPPSGKVLYNNILSPNYAVGDSLEFDHRTGLPDSMKYRFGLELTRNGDLVNAKLNWTTGDTQLNYSTPKLPLGKHHILWRIEQGGVERFCEYGFEVKDCAAPVVSCVAPFDVPILPFGNITLLVNDLLSSASDNITPSDKLLFGIRKSGQNGTGFPMDTTGVPITSVTFTCVEAYAIWPVELWARDVAGKTDSCIVFITIQDNLGVCGDPICFLHAIAQTSPLNEGVESVRFQVDGTVNFAPPFSYFDYSDADGTGFFHFLPYTSDIFLTPSKNDNPLNGVTTYDLVLISKHILGSEPLNTPYKIIAADANKSGSVTTFDIVETRKLILGIYDSLPNNTSWRFVDKGYQFPNVQNPFQSAFPENVILEDWSCLPNQFEFIGIKVGDVNNTAIPNANTPPTVEERAPSLLAFSDLELKAGETLEIPLYAMEPANWLGLQLGLDFDPELLEIEGIESAALPNFDQNNWAQPQSGRLVLSWSSPMPISISSSEAILRLRIRAHADLQLSKAFNTPEKPTLRSEAYDEAGLARPIHLVFLEKNTNEATPVFAPQPNPTFSGVIIPLQLSRAENLCLEVRDLQGRLLWSNNLKLGKGSHALEIPAWAMSQSGVYVWRMQAGDLLRSGRITRL